MKNSHSARRPSAVRTPTTAGQVRIIGGQWRRHLLAVPVHEGLRPSSDRVRETVFNWLNHLWGGQFADKRILDAFAGSGAFGLECVSRGARAVTLVDAYAPAMAGITQTLRHWAQQDQTVGRVQTRVADVLPLLRDWHKAGETFDLLLLDPPFGHEWLARLVPLMAALAHADTLLYVECEKNVDLSLLAEHGWQELRSGTTQQVRYGLWRL